MKQTITILLFCLVSTAAIAQSHEGLMVSYTAHTPNMRNGVDDLTNSFVLLANAGESKFFSPMTEYIDSLNSTPEGRAKYQEMTRSAYLGGKLDDMPRRDGTYYVVKSRDASSMTYYDNAGLEKYCYEESLPELDWQIGDSTKTVLGYECIQANAMFHGRRWTAWFTPEVPLNAGPWKLDGLPGLILEATCDGGQYSFEADGIQQTDREIGPVYLADEYEKTERIKFLKSKRSFLDNPLGKINAQLAGDMVVVKNEDGSDAAGRLFAPRETVDLIETDY